MNRMLSRGALSAIGAFALVISGLYAVEPAAAPPPSANSERFRLWNECRPMKVLLTVRHQTDGTKIVEGRTLWTSVRDTLQAAGLYSRESWEVVHTKAIVRKSVFTLTVEFRKAVEDHASLETGLSATWSAVVTEEYGGEPDRIIATLALVVDRFLKKYRTVNASACSR